MLEAEQISQDLRAALTSAFADGEIDYAVFTSASTVKGFAAANPTGSDLVVNLPEGSWTGLWNAEGAIQGTVTVPPMSVVLLGAN